MVVALDELADQAGTCTRCVLADGRTQVVFGVGDAGADLVVVGEAPGAEEDRLGHPFVGRSGQLLDRLLDEEVGVSRDTGAYIMNTVMCRPPGNRDPKPDELAACRDWFDAKLEALAPRVLLTVGNFASRQVLGTEVGITKLRGRAYPHPSGAVVIPTFHPAAALRGGGGVLAQMRADLVRAKQAIAGPIPTEEVPAR